MTCPLESQLSPRVCWPFRNTSPGCRLQKQDILSVTFSLQALFFQINLHFHRLKPLMGAAEHLGHISYCLGAEQSVSLLSQPPFPYLPCLQLLLCFRFLNPWEAASFNHFCIYLLLNGSFFIVNFSKCCYQELCHSLNALWLGNFLYPTIQHISFKLTFIQVPSAQVKWSQILGKDHTNGL